MIFGLTNQQKQEKYNRQNLLKIFGIRKFSFLPVMLDTGRYIWLDYYWKANCFMYEPTTCNITVFHLSQNHRCRDYYDWNITQAEKEGLDIIKEKFGLLNIEVKANENR